MKKKLVATIGLLGLAVAISQQVPYDPDKLPPGEVACGRRKSGEANPCKCMEARVKQSEEEQLRCELVPDKAARNECMRKHEVCSIVPLDVDRAGWDPSTGQRMPAQCKRSCSKARCECCQS